MPCTAAVKLAEKKLWGRISLKVALCMAIGSELAFSLFLCCMAFLANKGSFMALEFAEALVCATVFYAIYVGEQRWMLVYIGYSIFDIAYTALYALPSQIADGNESVLHNLVNQAEGDRTFVREMFEHSKREMRLHTIAYFWLDFAYVALAGTGLALVITAYREMNRGVVGQFKGREDIEEASDTHPIDLANGGGA